MINIYGTVHHKEISRCSVARRPLSWRHIRNIALIVPVAGFRRRPTTLALRLTMKDINKPFAPAVRMAVMQQVRYPGLVPL